MLFLVKHSENLKKIDRFQERKSKLPKKKIPNKGISEETSSTNREQNLNALSAEKI